MRILYKEYRPQTLHEKKVEEFKDFFIPGTVLISERASYRLGIGYPME